MPRAAIHLVDAGGLTSEHLAALEAALLTVGHSLDEVASVTATHLHPDHLGLAERIRARTGASIALHRVEQASVLSPPADLGELLDAWGVPVARRAELIDRPSPVDPVTADVLLDDGDRLPISGREIVVVHTPGHTAGSICLVDAAERLLFTGDHLLPDQFPGIGVDSAPVGNPIRDYLRSLERITAFADHEALPGHGWRFTGIPARVDVTRAHHARRTSEVAAALADESGAAALGARLAPHVVSGLAEPRQLLPALGAHADRVAPRDRARRLLGEARARGQSTALR